MILGTFFLSILGIRRAHHPATPAPEESAATRATEKAATGATEKAATGWD
jgi:hypothetical protein